MEEALQAPTIDPAKIEGIRAEQMKIADASSQRFTKALTDAGKVLTQSQRQAFFKNWNGHSTAASITTASVAEWHRERPGLILGVWPSAS